MKKLSYNDVVNIFNNNNCKLLDKEYKNSKAKMKYIAICGHIEEQSLDLFNQKKIKNCNYCNRKDNKNKNKKINLSKLKEIINNHLIKQLCYLNKIDFNKEILYKTKILCSKCKINKNIYLYYNRFSNTGRYFKDTICRQCNINDKRNRKKNHTIEQFINNILVSCKSSAKKRENKNRKKCGEFKLTIKDIYDLKQKQNNKCFFTNIELRWEYKSNNKVSIDRIDNDKGYIKDNIRLVIWDINQAQNNLSDGRFKELMYKIVLKDMIEKNKNINQLIEELKL